MRTAPIRSDLDRRRFLGVCSAFGLGTTLLPGVLYALAEEAPGKKEIGRAHV